MSHAKERKERNCLNCNAVVEDRYCGVCGQENLEPQETAGHLVGHFFNDITHFDGKFFSSMKYLLTKPGFLSKEYVAGRRASYLNPVRMYVFTSFIFFLIFFSVVSGTNERPGEKKKEERSDSAQVAANALEDSALKVNFNIPPVKGKRKKNDSDTISNEKEDRTFFARTYNGMGEYRDRKQYDSLVDAGKVKDNMIERALARKKLSLQARYGDDTRMMREKFNENLFHSIPQMFFLSLPLFALFLKLLYVRRKKFYYVAHAIFTIHLYIAIYIITLLTFLTGYLSDFRYLRWMDFVTGVLVTYIFYYGYKAMRNFYEQGRLKTILKYILIFFWLMIVVVVVGITMFAFSVYKL